MKDEIAEKALAALQNEDPEQAYLELKTLIAQNPQRIDLRHALASMLLRSGQSDAARHLLNDAIAMLATQSKETADIMIVPLQLMLAECNEELYDPRNAEQWTVGNVSRPYLHSNGREDGYCGFD